MKLFLLLGCSLAAVPFTSPRMFAQDHTAEKQAAPAADDAGLREQVDQLKARVEQLEGKTDRHGEASHEGDGSVIAPLARQIKLGGQIRVRGEYRTPGDYRLPGTFGRPAADRPHDDIDFVLLRTRLHADAELKDHLRTFIELQDSRSFGAEGSVLTDDEGLGLHQAYLDVDHMWDDLSLRLGRQELSYGDGRLVNALDWSNFSRTWDAAKLVYSVEGNQLDVFASIIREGVAFKPTDPNARAADDDQNFNGIYYHNTGLQNQEFDLYCFQRRFGNDPFTNEEGGKGDVRDYTIGAREKGKYGALDQSFEYAYQFGNRADDQVDAWALAAVLGVTGDDLPGKPRLSLEYDFATGDRDPTDGKIQTFDPLFPYGHFYQGFMDVFAWKNGGDLALRLAAKPCDRWTLELALHDFRLARAEDAWYDSAGNAIRRDPAGNSGTKVGNEIDLTARVAATDNLGLYLGYGYFLPGTFVRETGDSKDMTWAFAQATVNF
ncbi:MAG: alginate export family protein [Planctomycetota bacterium]